MSAATAVRRTIDAVWRIESPRLIAGLARIVRDVGLAEEIAQDALVSALEQWPAEGIPDNPGAWLMAAGKNRAIDRLRRSKRVAEKHEQIEHTIGPKYGEMDVEAIDDHIGDDLLRLLFTACHPVLSMDARVALTLRCLGGLTTEEIARAFVVPEPTIAQRIVRAKKTLADANVPFEVPRGEAIDERLASVLQVLYLVFNEGYSATAGDDWMRPALCDDAMRLGRMLVRLAPEEPEAHGLVALMEIQASRLGARTDANGDPILLQDQNRARWDRLLVRRGLEALSEAQRLGGGAGVYTLQAAIAACHARALSTDATDWRRIVDLYGALHERTGSPIVLLNRAVAVSMADGPAAALPLVDALREELEGYHLLPALRGDLLFKMGRLEEARTEFESAAALTKNEREKALLLERARNCI